MSLSEFIRKNKTLKSCEEIVFFGGSFNPWHEGHSACIKLLPIDKCLVVIPDHNPYKELVNNKQNSFEEIEQLVKKVRPHASIYDEFLKANRKNPTYFWLESLSSELPEKSYSLLMGFDTFLGIDKWIESRQLLRLLSTVYVVSRLDNPNAKAEQLAKLNELNPELKVVFLGGHPHENKSSTKIRQQS